MNEKWTGPSTGHAEDSSSSKRKRRRKMRRDTKSQEEQEDQTDIRLGALCLVIFFLGIVIALRTFLATPQSWSDQPPEPAPPSHYEYNQRPGTTFHYFLWW